MRQFAMTSGNEMPNKHFSELGRHLETSTLIPVQNLHWQIGADGVNSNYK